MVQGHVDPGFQSNPDPTFAFPGTEVRIIPDPHVSNPVNPDQEAPVFASNWPDKILDNLLLLMSTGSCRSSNIQS